MKLLKKLPQLLLAGITALQLTACSKTVQGEEDPVTLWIGSDSPAGTDGDVVDGGAGYDVLYGGAGSDIYASSGNATNDSDWRVAA